MTELLPSLLAADFADLVGELNKIEDAGIKILHLDVMDGNFVPNISFGPGLIKSLRKETDLVFDTHLMIGNPERYIEDFADAGSDYITCHYESTKHINRALQMVRETGLKAGLAINPGTPTIVVEDLLDYLDLILVMGVNPGFGGQDYIKQTSKKLFECKEMIDKEGRDIILSCDGGIKTGNVRLILDQGVDWIISGSDLFSAEDFFKRAEEYREIFREF